MAWLIRGTLLLLYVALVLPLPLLCPPDLRGFMGLGAALGLLLLVAITSEQVELDAEGLRVGHPRWCAWLLRRGWSLRWDQIRALTPVRTSQNGRVFYVRSNDDRAFLLPQRVQRFELFLARFATATGLDCRDVQRLTPPWTYRLLAALSASLLGAEVWALAWMPTSPPPGPIG
ncbi:MAG: hypothetical protein ACKOXO_01905 [Cyanobium sp.]